MEKSDMTEAEKRQAAQKAALKEAEQRRTALTPGPRPKEKGGQEGPEPTRYGDWEKAGIVSDF
ncbi:MAG TPA: DUF1674 domain-containing protein [Rhodobiaceae bacterium]|nr:DUF1674 domain-containing protein [Rhodobiaceae bacterium]